MLLQKKSPRHIHTISEKIVNTLPLEWQYSGIAYQLYSLLLTLLLMYNVSLIVLHHSTTLTGGRDIAVNYSSLFLLHFYILPWNPYEMAFGIPRNS